MTRMENCYNIADIRLAAKRRLPKAVLDFKA